jgi:uncharacterized protein (DUF58 family)
MRAATSSVYAAALARYEGLVLALRHGMGDRPGERRFPGRPQPEGVEVEAHSAYAPGDDLRHLDWNVLGRLDALLVRRYTAEREVVVHLLLDVSASMDAPPEDGKRALAGELALAIAFMALGANDAVRVALLGTDEAPRCSPVYRQRRSVAAIAEWLAAAPAAGAGDLGIGLTAYARRFPRPGAAVVISDLMLEPLRLEPGLRALRTRGYDVLLLHVIGAHELDPAGHFTHAILQDVETGATHPVRLTEAARAQYRALVDAHLAALEAAAAQLQVGYARLATGVTVPAFVTTELARLGVVRRR